MLNSPLYLQYLVMVLFASINKNKIKCNFMTRSFCYLSIFMLSVTLLLSSCFSTKSFLGTKYNYSFKLMDENAKTDNIFDDKKLQGVFIVGEKSLNFTLKNLTNEPMKINWDEASLIIYGESKRVMHKGVKFTERNSPQVPTIIPGNSIIDDLVIPTENVYYREGYYIKYASDPGGWEQNDLLLIWDMNKEETKNIIMNSKGQILTFFLPIEQNGLKVNYTFKFQVINVGPEVKL